MLDHTEERALATGVEAVLQARPGGDLDAALLWEVAAAAARWHSGQTRRSGEPYITHPLEVAAMVARWGMDEAAVVAAVLHDVVEDTEATLEDVSGLVARRGEEFAVEVTGLVAGLTKIDGLKLEAAHARQAASIARLLLAMVEDPRVLAVKLADRMHNMRTIAALPAHKQHRIASETAQVYAPLARRMGLEAVAAEMSDRCLAVTHPAEAADLESRIAEIAGGAADELARARDELTAELGRLGVEAEITMRRKGVASCHTKMQERGCRVEDISDLLGMRVVVADVPECYAALGAVHQLWIPVPKRFKDWIASPRNSTYQALHTTVVRPGGATMEVQIRSRAMHQRAESGMAAHWRYKASADRSDAAAGWLGRLTSELAARDAESRPEGFLAALVSELAGDEVLCFTPAGDVLSLPEGSTPVDFAYAVHSRVGERCRGARVNGRVVALSTKLQVGDRVEIITVAEGAPSRQWLEFVVSARARGRIRAHFAKLEREAHMARGRAVLGAAMARRGGRAQLDEEELDKLAAGFGLGNGEDILAAVATGRVDAATVAARLSGEERAGERKPVRKRVRRGLRRMAGTAPLVDDLSGVASMAAACCSPVPGDEVVGHVSARRGCVVVHRASCPNAGKGRAEVAVAWSDPDGPVAVTLLVEAVDRPGLLAEVTKVIGEAGCDITSSETAVGPDHVSRQRFTLTLPALTALEPLCSRLRAQVRGVERAERA